MDTGTQMGVVKMKESREIKVNIGGASVILIILVFALSVFAVLSIKASYNEWRLAQKTEDAVRKYYAADGRASEILADLHKIINQKVETDLLENMEEADSVTSVVELGDGQFKVSYQVPINDKSDLNVSVILYNGGYNITEWQVAAKELEGYDTDLDSQNLWDGTIINDGTVTPDETIPIQPAQPEIEIID